MRTGERGVVVGIVVAAALALRCGFVWTASIVHPPDAGQYAQYAVNLVTHGVYSYATTVPPPPDSFRSPGYPLFLAACRWVVGEHGWVSWAIAVQVVLGSLTVLCSYRLARAFLPFAPSVAAAVLCAASPHLVVASAYVLTECVTAFAVTAGLWLATDLRPRWRFAAAASALGAAVLCNEALVVLPIAVAWALRGMGTARAVLFALLALAPFAVWTLRNQAQTLAHTGGERVVASISHGSYPGMVFRDPRMFGQPYREDPEQPAFGSSWPRLREVLGRRVAERPVRYGVWYAVEKPVWLWGWNFVQGHDVLPYPASNSPYENHPVIAATRWLMWTCHLPVMVLAAAMALVASRNRRRQLLPIVQALGLVVVLGTLVYVPVIPDPRYLQPVRAVVFVLAAAGAAACFERLRQWLPRRRGELAAQAPEPAP